MGWKGWTIVSCVAFVLLVVFPIACFVWPTPYRYEQMGLSGTSYLVRIHRLTGTVERLMPFGWRRVGPSEPVPPAAAPAPQPVGPTELPASARTRVDVRFVFEYVHTGRPITITNGSSWTITGIKALLTEYALPNSSGDDVVALREVVEWYPAGGILLPGETTKVRGLTGRSNYDRVYRPKVNCRVLSIKGFVGKTEP